MRSFCLEVSIVCILPVVQEVSGQFFRLSLNLEGLIEPFDFPTREVEAIGVTFQLTLTRSHELVKAAADETLLVHCEVVRLSWELGRAEARPVPG